CLFLILARTLILFCTLILVGTLALNHEIGRPPIERHMELRVGHARAVNDRLIVAGEQSARFAKLGDPHWAEVFLEEGARLVTLERASARHSLADVFEGAGDRPRIAELTLPVEHLAARLEGRKGGAMIVTGPAVELGPLDRFKLAIRDLQRIDSGLAVRLRYRADEPYRGCGNPPNRSASNRDTSNRD